MNTWREQAVARSLDPARARAEKRVQRFLDAALELMTAGTGEFTVQEVVERSGQSLRSFYQHFGGKNELLLALLEESVRSTAESLGTQISDETSALDRLRVFVTSYYAVCRPLKGKRVPKGTAPVMVEFAQHLLTAQPEDAARTFAPLASLLVGLLDDAEAAGSIRGGLDHRRLAGIVLQSVMFNAFASTISASSPSRSSSGDTAEDLWTLLFAGIGSPSAA